jgi:hypothetical protein
MVKVWTVWRWYQIIIAVLGLSCLAILLLWSWPLHHPSPPTPVLIGCHLRSLVSISRFLSIRSFLCVVRLGLCVGLKRLEPPFYWHRSATDYTRNSVSILLLVLRIVFRRCQWVNEATGCGYCMWSHSARWRPIHIILHRSFPARNLCELPYHQTSNHSNSYCL